MSRSRFSLMLDKEEAHTLIAAAALGMKGKDPLAGSKVIEGKLINKLITLGQEVSA